jgi:hypothetical protein
VENYEGNLQVLADFWKNQREIEPENDREEENVKNLSMDRLKYKGGPIRPPLPILLIKY